MAWSQRQLNWIEQNRDKIDSGFYDGLNNIRGDDLGVLERIGLVLGIAYLRNIPLNVHYFLRDRLDATTVRYQILAKLKDQALYSGSMVAQVNSSPEALKNALAQGRYNSDMGFPKELFYELVIDRSKWVEGR